MLRMDDATVSVGGQDLLVGASLHLRQGDHAGLVGRNGSGKTTLLRVLVGERSADRGRVERRSGIRIGWLPQQAVSGSTKTVWEEAQGAMTRLNQLQDQLTRAQRAVQEEASEDALQALDRATEAFRIAGGFAADERIGEVLHGLGFGPDTWHRSCETFSGGWQMRIALARLLLSDPDVALLDEPTNHLDLQARTWLTGFLSRAPWAFLVVSHDRWLLERCVTRVIEIRHRTVHDYSGSYRSYLEQRSLRDEQLQSAFERQQKEIARLEGFVERFGAKATKASQARSRKNRLERMDRVEAPEADGRAPRLALPEPPAGAHEALSLVRATLGWAPDAPLLRDVDLTLARGTRTALLGPNGAGKSTLLHALAGRLKLLDGRRVVGDRVRIGVFDQDLAATLPAEPSALEYLTGEVPTALPQRIRAVLGALGLSGGMADRPIGKLSGGERARVALTSLVVRPHNVLLLDEPTNHLDAETTAVLATALAAWPGALLLITHDRWLVEAAATHVARIRHETVDVHEGVTAADFERAAAFASAEQENPQAVDHTERKRRQRELERARRRVAELESQIPEAEAEIRRIDDALVEAAMDHLRAATLARDRETASERVEALYAEWEALEREITLHSDRQYV